MMHAYPKQSGLAPLTMLRLSGDAPLRVAIPDLASYVPESGIGRVLHSLIAHWGAAVDLRSAKFKASAWPVLRNFPAGVILEGSQQTDLVFLPKLTGAQALRRTQGLPAVVTVHDIGVIDFPGDREGVDALSRFSVMRSFQGLRYAHAIIVDSAFTRQRLLHYLPIVADRVQIIHAGVNDYFLQYQPSREEARHFIAEHCGNKLGTPLLIYVGSELPRKNITTLLDAFQLVRQRHPSAMLLKVGWAGGARWRMRTLAEAQRLGLQLGRDLLIVEDLDDAGLAAAYRAADVFVTASLYEGFGLPALEAMAVGTPVVVTNCGALPEIVGAAGTIVPPVGAALAAAVEHALSGRNENVLRSQASLFSWTRAAQRYLELFKLLADSSIGHPRGNLNA